MFITLKKPSAPKPHRIIVVILMFKIKNSCDFLTDKFRTANLKIIVFFRIYMVF